MAGAVVGQAFLSAFLDVVFDRLASPEVANFIRRNKLDHDLLQRLKTTLYAVEAVLNDAELKQIKNSAVNRWLVDLKDAVYEADDLLDRVSTQAATPKEASNFFSRFLNFQEREMVAKLEDTVGRLDSIFKLKDILGLKENASDNLSWRSPSTSLEEGSKIYGRDKDKEAILKLLLDDDKNDGEISVIPIVETKVGVRTRHLSFSMLSDPLSENFDVSGRLKFLRTFLPVDLKESPFHNEEAARLILLNLKCPRFRGQLPTHLPSLGSLLIDDCNQLACCLPSAPCIRELRIRISSKVRLQEVPSSLEVLWIEGSQVESMFEAITNSNSNSQPSSSNFYSFLGDCLPASLTQLEISNCSKLHFSNKNADHLPDFLPSLPLDTFTNLNELNIYNCKNIGCVTVSQSLPKLATFSIRGCPNVASFPTQGLPAPNLFRFTISYCNKLESLPSHMNTLLPKLEYLCIDDCPEMESFPEGGMPPSLRTLSIINCHKLLGSPSLASMDMLSELHIWGSCEEVNSFPKEGLVLLPPSLTFLELYSLKSVETLECKGLVHLTSLQRLTIGGCPKLENMVGERLPASLIKLEIKGCPLLQERARFDSFVWITMLLMIVTAYPLMRLLVHAGFFATTKVINDDKKEVAVPQIQCSNLVSFCWGNVSSSSSSLMTILA
ncbi:hypothetical protein VNO77_21918 [Canavalia gladiata]|uniref:Disease resistance N-terminal domain-containing protein n=1 Tax=Canavalia gladiata TaxID=3824 RepID=A0AAN9L2I6_CANGL